MKTIASLLLSILASTELSYACSCVAQPRDARTAVKKALEGADLVFLGRIESTETFKVNQHDFETEYERTQFYVLQSWKGEIASRVYVQSPVTCCMCGFDFPKSGVFLVYAYGPDKDGYYSTSSCSRTQASKEAKKDIALLNESENRPR